MQLKKLLSGLTVTKMFQQFYGQKISTQDIEINQVCYDSRKVQKGDLFVAIRGTLNDGNKYITESIERGALVIVTDQDCAIDDSYLMHKGVAKILVPDARIALAIISGNYYEHADRDLILIGVTGTNGKTTTTYLIQHLFKCAGKTMGLIGTIEYDFGDERVPANHTTPESLELHQMFSRMKQSGCTSVSMEVSSHALDQNRVYGINFDTAVFTNLTQDHLDYHGTMDNYFEAKKKLFTQIKDQGTAIINVDDEWGAKLCELSKHRTITYSINNPADVRASNIVTYADGIVIDVTTNHKRFQVKSLLIGGFNVYNILSTVAVGKAFGFDDEIIQNAVCSAKQIPGRFERIVSPGGWTVVIDYAHTPDALKNVLMTLQQLRDVNRGNKIICIFGCGGERDVSKRPLMGRISSEFSDVTIVTSDNPRSEDPEKVIDDIMSGVVGGKKVLRESDREQAIHLGLSMAQRGDLVLIAGKGHEEYQIIGNRKIRFSDRDVVNDYLRRYL